MERNMSVRVLVVDDESVVEMLFRQQFRREVPARTTDADRSWWTGGVEA